MNAEMKNPSAENLDLLTFCYFLFGIGVGHTHSIALHASSAATSARNFAVLFLVSLFFELHFFPFPVTSVSSLK